MFKSEPDNIFKNAWKYGVCVAHAMPSVIFGLYGQEMRQRFAEIKQERPEIKSSTKKGISDIDKLRADSEKPILDVVDDKNLKSGTIEAGFEIPNALHVEVNDEKSMLEEQTGRNAMEGRMPNENSNVEGTQNSKNLSLDPGDGKGEESIIARTPSTDLKERSLDSEDDKKSNIDVPQDSETFSLNLFNENDASKSRNEDSGEQTLEWVEGNIENFKVSKMLNIESVEPISEEKNKKSTADKTPNKTSRFYRPCENDERPIRPMGAPLNRSAELGRLSLEPISENEEEFFDLTDEPSPDSMSSCVNKEQTLTDGKLTRIEEEENRVPEMEGATDGKVVKYGDVKDSCSNNEGQETVEKKKKRKSGESLSDRSEKGKKISRVDPYFKTLMDAASKLRQETKNSPNLTDKSRKKLSFDKSVVSIEVLKEKELEVNLIRNILKEDIAKISPATSLRKNETSALASQHDKTAVEKEGEIKGELNLPSTSLWKIDSTADYFTLPITSNGLPQTHITEDKTPAEATGNKQKVKINEISSLPHLKFRNQDGGTTSEVAGDIPKDMETHAGVTENKIEANTKESTSMIDLKFQGIAAVVSSCAAGDGSRFFYKHEDGKTDGVDEIRKEAKRRDHPNLLTPWKVRGNKDVRSCNADNTSNFRTPKAGMFSQEEEKTRGIPVPRTPKFREILKKVGSFNDGESTNIGKVEAPKACLPKEYLGSTPQNTETKKSVQNTPEIKKNSHHFDVKSKVKEFLNSLNEGLEDNIGEPDLDELRQLDFMFRGEQEDKNVNNIEPLNLEFSADSEDSDGSVSKDSLEDDIEKCEVGFKIKSSEKKNMGEGSEVLSVTDDLGSDGRVESIELSGRLYEVRRKRESLSSGTQTTARLGNTEEVKTPSVQLSETVKVKNSTPRNRVPEQRFKSNYDATTPTVKSGQKISKSTKFVVSESPISSQRGTPVSTKKVIRPPQVRLTKAAELQKQCTIRNREEKASATRNLPPFWN